MVSFTIAVYSNMDKRTIEYIVVCELTKDNKYITTRVTRSTENNIDEYDFKIIKGTYTGDYTLPFNKKEFYHYMLYRLGLGVLSITHDVKLIRRVNKEWIMKCSEYLVAYERLQLSRKLCKFYNTQNLDQSDNNLLTRLKEAYAKVDLEL